MGKKEVPSLDEVIAAKTDLWGELAMAQTNGASYNFFADLLPPLRYVNALFRHYPIVLSAPGNQHKARLLSNGSGVNSLASIDFNWHEVGFPATFRVGDREELFGADLSRLEGPSFFRGYLPIVAMQYALGEEVYGQEVFVATEPPFADHALVFVKFHLVQGEEGTVSVHIGAKGTLQVIENALCDEEENVLIWLDENWSWDSSTLTLTAQATSDDVATLGIFTKPPDELPDLPLTEYLYEEKREECEETWEAVLANCMFVETPEPVVNDAWRASVIGIHMLLRDNVICYSVHNQYQKLYEAEGSEVARGLALWGLGDDVRDMILPLLDFTRKGLEYHQAGLKLQLLSHCYWLTRDEGFIREHRERWTPEVERIVNDREEDTGLFPREQYCGDIHTLVYALKSNTNSCRGLKDFAAVLDEIGEKDEARELMVVTEGFREAIAAAVKKSERHDVSPPFIPNALFGEEEPCDKLTDTKLGSYWDLIAPYILESGVLGAEREQWMIEYLQQHGGICMGMIRCRPNGQFWVQKSNVNDLYGRRYTHMLLKNDDVERALVSFYGKLAQGFTRDTFIGAEGSCLVPADEFGRQMYLPPNSASNAYYLWMLRYLLVQDWDMDGDGRPDTLRLMFATPKRWLEDGKSIVIEGAPTAFGRVSISMESALDQGRIIAEVSMPERLPKVSLLRCRVPEGWTITSAIFDGQEVDVDDSGTVDISTTSGGGKILFKVVEN